MAALIVVGIEEFLILRFEIERGIADHLMAGGSL